MAAVSLYAACPHAAWMAEFRADAPPTLRRFDRASGWPARTRPRRLEHAGDRRNAAIVLRALSEMDPGRGRRYRPAAVRGVPSIPHSPKASG